MLHTTQFAVPMMIAGCLAGVGFLLWFLLGLIIESRRNRAADRVSWDYASPAPVEMTDDQVAEFVPITALRHSMRFDLTKVIAASLERRA